MNHQHFLKLAKDCSSRADYTGKSKVQMGCVCVYKGTVLAKGWNTDRTHTTQMLYNHLRYDNKHINSPNKLHAELNVINKIKYLDIDFSKVILYVYREFKSGSNAMARPCASCMAAAKKLGIKTIVYTTSDGYAIEKLK